MASELISALGGNGVVAKALGVAPNVVANWHHLNIPWPRRQQIARLAEEKGVKLPVDFWGDAA